MIGRMIIRPLVAVAAIYVLLAMAAALARVPGHGMGDAAAYVHDAPAAAVDAELHELRTEDVVP